VSELERQQAQNPEAYDLYLRGRYFWNQLSPPTTQRALEFFARATDVDPHYALAWSGIADALATSPITGDASPLQVWPRAKEAAERAVRVAPNLAEVQTSVGFVKFWLDWDWMAAETAFRKAIEANPSYALGHRMLGMLLSHLNRKEEARSAIKRARELDPLNVGHYALSAQIAFAGRDFPAAVEFAQQAIAIDPEFWIGHIQLGQTQEQLNNTELALEALVNATRMSGNSKGLSVRAYVLAKAGKAEAALQLLHALEESASGGRYVPPYAIALIYLGLGEKDLVFEYLERAYDAHDVHLAFLTCDAKWDGYRGEARFVDLVGRCGFGP
jgi:tetratricopeptide (TPR) repeat protein